MSKTGITCLTTFLAEVATRDPEGRVRRRDLRALYSTWCADHDCVPASPRAIAAALRELGCHEGVHGDGTRYWGGIAIEGLETWGPEDEVLRMQRFIAAHCNFHPGAGVAKTRLYEDYVAWCKKHRYVPETQKRLGHALRRACSTIRHTTRWDLGAGCAVPSWGGVETKSRGSGSTRI